MPITRQNNSTDDGLIQTAFATLAFSDVFTASTGGWDGYFMVDFVAGNEPYTAFDFADLSVDPINPENPLSAVPEPATLLLLRFGLIGFTGVRRKKKK